MWKTLHSFMLVLVAACCLVLIPSVAMADDLSCNDGVPNDGTELFPSSGPNSPCANIDPNAPIDSASAIGQHIFSWIICSYVQILDYVLDNMYCSMQYNMMQLLSAVFTVYIVIFGIQLLMGTAQLTAKEFLIRCMKIAGVWMFITDATYGVSMAFGFFVEVAADGTSWVLNGVMQSAPFTDPTSPGYATLSPLANSYANSGGTMPIYGFLDQLVYNAVIGPFTETNSKVATFFVMCIETLPTIAALIGWYLLENLKIVARALISFMIGVSALAFLIALSPIFLSLMLFQITYHFFDNWVKYMISFSLQIVIIFACIGMWLAVTSYFIGFFNNLSDVLVSDNTLTRNSGTQTDINQNVAICKYAYNDPNPPNNYLPTLTATGDCEDDEDASPSPDVYDPSPGATQKYKEDQRIQVTDLANQANETDPTKGFIVYITTNLLALLLITYAFSALLQSAPDIARQLAGPEYVPLIGQGMGFTRYGQLRGLSTIRPESGTRQGGSFFGGGSPAPTGDNKPGSKSDSFIGQAMNMIARRPGNTNQKDGE